MVVVAVMVRRAGHCGGGVAEMGRWGKGGGPTIITSPCGGSHHIVKLRRTEFSNLKQKMNKSVKRIVPAGDPRIIIPAVFTNVSLGGVLSRLHYTITILKSRSVILDFSSCKSVFEAGMLPLMPILGRYRKISKVHFSLILPKDETLSSLFIRTNWAHLIDPFKYNYDENITNPHCPAFRFGNPGEQFSAVDKVLSVVLNSMPVSRDLLKAIEWSVNEITDNVINHAGPNSTGYVQAMFFRDSNIVEFVVADAGIGIAKSLGLHDHKIALERAIQEGVTRNAKTNQGNGLYGSFQIARAAQGQFNIYSRFASLRLSPQGTVKLADEKIPYSGTAVRWNMRTDASDVISRALRFRDESHTIAFDYLDRFDVDGEIVVNVKSQFVSLGSRDAGIRALSFIRNLLESTPNAINLDFSDVNIISSSFADEVLGRLFVELGPVGFMTRIKLKNADRETMALIDRAIVQRSGMSH